MIERGGSDGVSGERLAVVWSSADADVARRVALIYARNAWKHGWFDGVELIVWGPSAKLLSEDVDLQVIVKDMMAEGVVVRACRWCADEYGVAAHLEALGIEVIYMGKPLTTMLKSGVHVITF